MRGLAARVAPAGDFGYPRNAAQNMAVLVQLGVQRAFAKGAWWVDSVELDPQALQIRGWAKAPNPYSGKLSFTVNDVPFDSMETGLDRPGVAQALGLPSDQANLGFWTRIDRSKLGTVDQFRLRFENAYTRRPFDENQDFWYICVDAPVPEEKRRKRIGGGDLNSFLIQGASAYAKFSHVLRTMFDSDFDHVQRVLDWGCGCGRVSRFIALRNQCKLTGLDIDGDNVEWCKTNLPNATFKTIDPEPPTPIDSNYFDVIFGISVFTHLSEEDQFKWLAELRRIAKPGSILLMTVNAETHWFRMTHWKSVERTLKWQTSGYIDLGSNPSLDGHVKVADRYRKAKHTTGYVLREWSKYFDIVDVLPGYIGNQDLVVMVKRDEQMH